MLLRVQRLVREDAAPGFDLDGVAGQAYLICKAAFDRVPDPGGPGDWIATLLAAPPTAALLRPQAARAD
jgi:hypothetical protein